MINNWTNWTDDGTPTFSGTAETTLQIVRDRGDRGRWFGVWSERVAADDRFRIKVTTGGRGTVTVTFWDGSISSEGYKGSQQFGAGEIESVIVIPADGSDLFRVEFRGWDEVAEGQSSIDTFTDILITDTIPDPPQLAAPTMEDVTVEGDEISIAWSAVDGAELYELHEQENDGAWVEVYAGPNTSAVFGAFPAGVYCYRARSAAGTAVSEWSNILCGTVEEKPVEEKPVIADIENPDHIGDYVITWSAVDGADSYELQENRNERAWIEVYAGPETEFAQSGNPVGSYCYRVRAIVGGEAGEWSAIKCSSHWEGEQYVYHIPQPDGLFEWTVTVSNTSATMARYPVPAEDAAAKLIEEMIKDAPEDDPILLPPEIG
jgi:hypothetical protein